MSRFIAQPLPLAGLQLLERRKMADQRGFLSRLFCSEDLAPLGWVKPVAQINHTNTIAGGTVRGIHYQVPPFGEMKLVTVVRGEVWDVAVDLRAESPTFLKWHAEVLSAANGLVMFIPEGFAHGFQTLTDDVDMIYCHSTAFNPAAEGGINPLDKSLNVQWPLELTDMSARDREHPYLDGSFAGLTLS